MVDFLIGTTITYWLIIRETMGKGNGIYKGHGRHGKRGSHRVASAWQAVNWPLALSLSFEKLAAMTRLTPLSIALPSQLRGSWKVLTLKGCTAPFTLDRHG
jgi:hypothetical protein